VIHHLKKHRIESYLQKITDEFKSKRDRILSLTDHDLTIGEWREEILRNFTKEHISDRFGVGKGFIYNHATNKVSRQCDIIIYDKQSTHPIYFKDYDLVVVPPEVVVCIIEVKSNLDHASLESAFNNIESAKKLSSNPTRLIGYVFSYDTAWDTPYDFARILGDWKKRVPKIYYPECIITLSKQIAWAFSDQEIGRHYIIADIKPWYGGDHTMAFFWGVLNTTLATWTGDLQKSNLDPAKYIQRFYEFDRGDRVWIRNKIIVGSKLTEKDRLNLKCHYYNYLSRLAVHRGITKDAILYAKKALSILENPYSHFNLSQALEWNGDFQEALTEIKKSINTRDYRPQPFLNMANIYFLLKEYGNALASIQRAIRKCQDKEELETCYGFKYRILTQLGQDKTIRDSFDKECPNPTDPSTVIWKGIALINLGSVDEGQNILIKADSEISTVEFVENYENKALINIKLGHKIKCKKLLIEYLQLRPIAKNIILNLPEFTGINLD